MSRKKPSTPPFLGGRDAIGTDVTVDCPFSVAVDSNELQHGYDYKFRGLKANASHGHREIAVPLVYRHLGKGHGDYQVEGIPGFAVERKTKADLFGSVVKRDNFVERLTIMSEVFRASCVVVEAEISEIRADPPPFTNYSVKSLLRTIQSWTLAYPTVHWCFLPGRAAAEAWTFRMLEFHWHHHHRTEAK